MATKKELETYLTYLKDTMHFETVFEQVFKRILHGQGNGLIILQGPSKTANKSFFLKVVKAFQYGVPLEEKSYFSSDLQRLLDEINMSHYQCVDMKEDCPIGVPKSYEVPLYLDLPLSLASASQKRGLKKGHGVVVLCDDLQEFLRHNKMEQMVFIGQVARLTRDHKELTFLGAYTLDWNGKGLEDTALSEYVLALGYD